VRTCSGASISSISSSARAHSICTLHTPEGCDYYHHHFNTAHTPEITIPLTIPLTTPTVPFTIPITIAVTAILTINITIAITAASTIHFPLCCPSAGPCT